MGNTPVHSELSVHETDYLATPHPGLALDDHHSLIDSWTEFVHRLASGRGWIAMSAGLGLALGTAGALFEQRQQPAITTARVVLSFPGFERGEYPDRSKFQPNDLRRLDIIREALRRQGVTASDELAPKVRSAIAVEDIVPVEVVTERDRRRNAGQSPAPYVSDEYSLDFDPAAGLSFSAREREQMLGQLVAIFRDNFQRTHGDVPADLGHAFETLQGTDYADYEMVFTTELAGISAFLRGQIDQARAFRSRATGFSFQDLLDQTDLFARIHLNESLGLIREYGLSRNRATSLVKMQNQMRSLEDRERRVLGEQQLVAELLSKSQSHSQKYALSLAEEAARPPESAPLIDQDLVATLVANNANNFLVRQAVEAGEHLAEVQNEKLKSTELRDSMETFLRADKTDQTAAVAQVEESLQRLRKNYMQLMEDIRRTQADFAKQRFTEIIRFSRTAHTPGAFKTVALAGAVGAVLGLAFGCGLSLLGIRARTRAKE